MPRQVILFISPGRAGTQWLTDTFGAIYASEALVEHEPLRDAFNLRKFFRQAHLFDDSEEAPAVNAHFDRIDAVGPENVYIDTGWTVIGLIPVLEKRFGERVRVVRLLRHPVENALSMLTHGMYASENGGISAWGELRPGDNIIQQGYETRWKSLSQYEKCLFQWTELHLYGEELERELGSRRVRPFRMEDLFDPGGGALDELAEFCGLTPSPELSARVGRKVDRFRQSTSVDFHWEEIFDHEETVDLARRHGYDFDGISPSRLERRYRRHVANLVRDQIRSGLRTLRKNLGLGK